MTILIGATAGRPPPIYSSCFWCRYESVYAQRSGGRGDGCATFWCAKAPPSMHVFESKSIAWDSLSVSVVPEPDIGRIHSSADGLQEHGEVQSGSGAHHQVCRCALGGLSRTLNPKLSGFRPGAPLSRQGSLLSRPLARLHVNLKAIGCKVRALKVCEVNFYWIMSSVFSCAVRVGSPAARPRMSGAALS